VDNSKEVAEAAKATMAKLDELVKAMKALPTATATETSKSLSPQLTEISKKTEPEFQISGHWNTLNQKGVLVKDEDGKVVGTLRLGVDEKTGDAGPILLN
jgi:hypothetical protein